MSAQKKVLIPGGTGAMGVYLVPELLKLGYAVDVVSLDDKVSNDPNLRYFKANFKEDGVAEEFLKNGYDGIIDFMVYETHEFKEKVFPLIENCGHYIFLSSYRVYANEEHPITESSPRLLDVSTDREFLASDNYSLYKARGENFLNASELQNWTAVRPAITFSQRRYQLVTMEAGVIVQRAREGKTVILPEEAMNVQATMTWAGDVAKMIARLLFNEKAYREVYTVSTSEHNTWGTIAEYYRELIGMKYITVPRDVFLSITAPEGGMDSVWQLDYDRLYDRIVDNSKILAATGLKQSDFTTVYDGLKRELSNLPKDVVFSDPRNAYMDAYLKEHNLT